MKLRGGKRRNDVVEYRHIQEASKVVIALELFVFTQKRVMFNSCGIEKWKDRKSKILGNSNTSNKVLNIATPIFQVEISCLTSRYSVALLEIFT